MLTFLHPDNQSGSPTVETENPGFHFTARAPENTLSIWSDTAPVKKSPVIIRSPLFHKSPFWPEVQWLY